MNAGWILISAGPETVTVGVCSSGRMLPAEVGPRLILKNSRPSSSTSCSGAP